MNNSKIYTLVVNNEENKIIENNLAISEKDNPKINYHNCVCVKPWGYEFLAYESEKIGIWFLRINKGHATSLHAHFKKDTFIIVLQGCAKVSLIDDTIALNKLESVYIPKNKFHGIGSFSDCCYLMEIEIYDKTVNFSDKNDLIRINDQYHRSYTGYESSVEVKRDNLHEYNHFSFHKEKHIKIFDTDISIENLESINIKANYNIILSGEVYKDGIYLKEGSLIKEKTTGKVEILSIINPFSYEDSKIIHSKEQLEVVISKLKKTEKKIILTSGCYDIVHVGHLTHLKNAKMLGDILMVCLSSDEQIKKLKGEDRPINNYNDRINLFKTISYVDYIILYNEEHIETEETLGSIMKSVDPYCWTKGTDYTVDAILKKHPYLKKIILFENVKDKSTTNIIKKIQSKEY